MISAALSGYFNAKEKPSLRLIAKLIASLMFCAAGLTAIFLSKNYSSYSVFVTAALILGLLGDVFLCMNGLVNKRAELLFDGLGVVTFTLGHIFFISIFLSMAPFKWYLLPAIIVLPAALSYLMKIKFINAGKLSLAFVLYSCILGLMAVSAVNLFISNINALGAVILAAGLLFTASDISFVIRRSGNISDRAKKILIYVVLITYYAAQSLFAISIYFHA